jgi:hypothetical protein
VRASDVLGRERRHERPGGRRDVRYSRDDAVERGFLDHELEVEVRVGVGLAGGERPPDDHADHALVFGRRRARRLEPDAVPREAIDARRPEQVHVPVFSHAKPLPVDRRT